jgi:hypothetical protein
MFPMFKLFYQWDRIAIVIPSKARIQTPSNLDSPLWGNDKVCNSAIKPFYLYERLKNTAFFRTTSLWNEEHF